MARTLGKRSVRHYIRDKQRKGNNTNTFEMASCYGKIRFDKRAARGRAAEISGVRAYKCKFCKHWHVGGKHE